MNTSNPPSGRGEDYYCGGRLRDGSGKTCRRRAGHGTPTPGTGRCRLHGGNTPSHRRRAERVEAERAVTTYGLPVDVDPREALLQEVHRTAGHVAWLAEVVAGLPDDALGWSVAEQTARRIVVGKDEDGDGVEGEVVDTKRRAVPHVLVSIYQTERKHLREVCRDAVSAGVQERVVQLAEQQGMALAGAIRAILGDLNLTPDQLALVPAVVPKHLRAVAANGNGAPG
jgi:hypothetical protein